MNTMKKRTYFLIVPAIITIAVFGFFSKALPLAIRGDSSMKNVSTEDSTIITNVYYYRSLVSMYDSVIVGCMYGEMCLLPNQATPDSTMIQWKNFYDAPGIDTSAATLFSLSGSKSFVLTDSSTLSLFRMIYMGYRNPSLPYSVPDSTCWTLELWNASSATKIATIDSVGICRATCIESSEFPNTFGLYNSSNSYEKITIALGGYAAQADTVFLKFGIRNWLSGQDRFCNLNDGQSINTKFTESHSLQKGSSRQSIPTNISLTLFPNPARTMSGSAMVKVTLPSERYIELALFSSIGTKVKTIYAGIRPAGANIIPIDYHALSSGTYFLRAFDHAGQMIVSENFIITR